MIVFCSCAFVVLCLFKTLVICRALICIVSSFYGSVASCVCVFVCRCVLCCVDIVVFRLVVVYVNLACVFCVMGLLFVRGCRGHTRRSLTNHTRL